MSSIMRFLHNTNTECALRNIGQSFHLLVQRVAHGVCPSVEQDVDVKTPTGNAIFGSGFPLDNFLSDWIFFDEISSFFLLRTRLIWEFFYFKILIIKKVFWFSYCGNQDKRMVWVFHRIFSYFGHVHYYFHWNWRKLKNSSLMRWKNTKETIINHKRTKMVKDGEDKHG